MNQPTQGPGTARRVMAPTAPVAGTAVDPLPFEAATVYDSVNELIVDLYENEHRILDVGCGTGHLAKALKSLNPRAVIEGIDVSSAAGTQAKERLDTFHLRDLDRDPLPPFAEPFDLIIAGDVLEHLKRPDDLLRRLGENLKENGGLIVSVPNVAHYFIRMKLLMGRFQYTETGIMDRTHLRFFTQGSIRELMRVAGFSVVSERFLLGPKAAVLARLVPGPFRAPLLGGWLAMGFVFKARRSLPGEKAVKP